MHTTPAFRWLVLAALAVIVSRIAVARWIRVRRARRELARRRPNVDVRFVLVDHARPRIRAVQAVARALAELTSAPRVWH